MKLPGREKAYVPPRKLIDYILSPSHPVGGSKARFFRAAGFDETNAASLERALIDIARSEDVTEIEQRRTGRSPPSKATSELPREGRGGSGQSGSSRRAKQFPDS